MGGVRSMRPQKQCTFDFGNPKERDRLEDPGEDSRMMLK